MNMLQWLAQKLKGGKAKDYRYPQQNAKPKPFKPTPPIMAISTPLTCYRARKRALNRHINKLARGSRAYNAAHAV